MKTEDMRVKRFNRQGVRKRIKLLESAGKAFAKYGYAGTAIRDISDVAKVQPSAFIYHFGNKENLFHETLRYHILRGAKFNDFFASFEKTDPKNNPQSISNALYESISKIQQVAHGDKKVSNLAGLFICLFMDGSFDACQMISEIGESAMKKVFEDIKTFKPEITDNEIFWFGRLFWACIFYPTLAKKLFLAKFDEKNYSEAFINSIAYRTAGVCCMYVGLPQPTNGKDDWVLGK